MDLETPSRVHVEAHVAGFEEYLSPSMSGKFGKRSVASLPLSPVSRQTW